MAMSKAERDELKQLVKRRMKVLRADVAQREAELRNEVAANVKQDMKGEDQVWAQVAHALGEAERSANRQANDALRTLLGAERWPNELRLIQAADAFTLRNRLAQDQAGSTPMRQALIRDGEQRITTMVKDAQRKLERIETDLLTDLAVGALESDEAKAFLARIPTVGELVSAERLREITS